jgi:hypothetical protein
MRAEDNIDAVERPLLDHPSGPSRELFGGLK